MDLSHLLETYGYVVVFLGTLVEGESVLMLGGYLAHRGYLDLPGVIATAFAGAVCGDQFFFYLGRRHAHGFLKRLPLLHAKVEGALHRVEQHQVKLVLFMRFMWGLRIAMPVAIGMTKMSVHRFFWLNLLSAAFWSVAFALVGFSTSQVLAKGFEGFHQYEKWIVGGLAAIAVVVLATRWLRARRPEPHH